MVSERDRRKAICERESKEWLFEHRLAGGWKKITARLQSTSIKYTLHPQNTVQVDCKVRVWKLILTYCYNIAQKLFDLRIYSHSPQVLSYFDNSHRASLFFFFLCSSNSYVDGNFPVATIRFYHLSDGKNLRMCSFVTKEIISWVQKNECQVCN